MKTVKGSARGSDIPLAPVDGPSQGREPKQCFGEQYGLNFEEGDAWFYEWFGPLSTADRARIVFAFLKEHPGVVVEYFVLALMPESFIEVYEEKRGHAIKEAFRRAIRKIFAAHTPTRLPLLDTVLNHIRATGSFRIEDLGDVLGRTPVDKEVHEVSTFLSSLSNDDLRALLNSH